MSFTAAGHRHLGTLWKSKTTPWHWASLAIGTAQAGKGGRWSYRVGRWLWQLHVTPVHIHREGGTRCFGLCWGARTIYVRWHR